VGPTLTVATYNVHLGADLRPLFHAGDPQAVAERASQVWQHVMAADPAGRMSVAADLIAAARPDVLAVQEAVRWTRTAPDGEVSVLLDQLDLLLAALARRGSPYRVAARAETFTSTQLRVELPVVGAVTLADAGLLLVRDDGPAAGLEVVGSRGGCYRAAMPLQMLGLEVPLVRGWCAVDLRIGGAPVRVIATHLEAFETAVRVAQAEELLAIALPDLGPVVVLGDLNCRAPDERPASGHQAAGYDAYEVLAGAGLRDGWLGAPVDGSPGWTCRPESGLADSGARFDHRIDLAFHDAALSPVAARALGDDDASGMTADGWWASDHGCLTVTFELRGGTAGTA